LLNPFNFASCHSLASLAAGFIAMSGTVVKDKDASGLVPWLQLVCDFPITKENYLLGMVSLIAFKQPLKIEVVKECIEVAIPPSMESAYRSLIPASFGGFEGVQMNYLEAVKICYSAVFDAMFTYVAESVKNGVLLPILLVVKDESEKQEMKKRLDSVGARTILVSDHFNLGPSSPLVADIDVALTTMGKITGFNAHGCGSLVSAVYASNQAKRTQMLGRILRLGQPRSSIKLLIFKAGIMSYTCERYKKAEVLESSIRDLFENGCCGFSTEYDV